MDQRIFVARLNIEHFRRKLADETDGRMQQTLLNLLADEEAKLKALELSPNDDGRRSAHSPGRRIDHRRAV